MNFNMNGLTRTIGRQVLVTKKNSPHIFFVGGVVGIAGTVVLACRATLKLEESLDEIKKETEAVRKDVSEKQGDSEQAQQVVAITSSSFATVKTIGVVGRLYAPSIALGAVSVAALTGSHIQLTRRNAALSATLAIVTKAYDEYRVRVQEEIGKEKEEDIYRNIKSEEKTIDGKKQIVKVADPNGRSPYARFFDECSVNYQKDAEMNRIFLECQQSYMNHRLRAYGHVFLNEVYDALGLERSQAGQVVGWIMDGDGDNYIDFGMYEVYNHKFINNMERSVLLDFNVDGVVYDKI